MGSLGVIENHLADGQDEKVGFTRGTVGRVDQDGAALGVGPGHVGNLWAGHGTPGRPAGSRSPRTAECGSPCPPWGKACCYCGEGGGLRSVLGPLLAPLPQCWPGLTIPGRIEYPRSPARRSHRVPWRLSARLAFSACSAARQVAGRVRSLSFAKRGEELRTCNGFQCLCAS